MLLENDLPDDLDALRALVIEERQAVSRLTADVAMARAEVDRLTGAEAEAEAEIARLNAIIAAFQRHRFGARSEKLDADQFELVLEEPGAALARVKAGIDARAPSGGDARPRKTNRGSLPGHLERIEQIIDIDDKTCSCTAARSMPLARMSPSGSMSFLRPCGCWSPGVPDTAAGPVRG